MTDDQIQKLVDKFLAWPLPQSVCSDLCVTDKNYKFPRSGTNLLTADESRQMFEYLMGTTTRVRMSVDSIEDKNILHQTPITD